MTSPTTGGFSARQQSLLCCLTQYKFKLVWMWRREERAEPVPAFPIYSAASLKFCSQMWRSEWCCVWGGIWSPLSHNWFALCSAELLGLALQISVDTRPLASINSGLPMQFQRHSCAIILSKTKHTVYSSEVWQKNCEWHISWHTLLTFGLNEASQI